MLIQQEFRNDDKCYWRPTPQVICNAMVFVKMRLILPLKTGSETYRCTKGAFEHSRKPGPKSVSKTFMKVELKETSYPFYATWRFGQNQKRNNTKDMSNGPWEVTHGNLGT